MPLVKPFKRNLHLQFLAVDSVSQITNDCGVENRFDQIFCFGLAGSIPIFFLHETLLSLSLCVSFHFISSTCTAFIRKHSPDYYWPSAWQKFSSVYIFLCVLVCAFCCLFASHIPSVWHFWQTYHFQCNSVAYLLHLAFCHKKKNPLECLKGKLK